MTDREKAIVMAYTGVTMLKGEKLNIFYKYLDELYNRPVHTHELGYLDTRQKSLNDFIRLCEDEQYETMQKSQGEQPMDYKKVLEHYLDGIDKDVSLVDDAIMTLEQHFNYIDGDTLLHHSRPLAMAYLALREVADKNADNKHNSQRGQI